MTVFLSIRIDQTTLDEFKEFCSQKLQRRHSDVVRELIVALKEGRVSITPTEAVKELYK